MNYFKKFFIFFITTLVVLSIFVFPALATATSNTVTWDYEFIWLNTYRVRSCLTVSEYTGLKPTTTFWAITNNDIYFTARVVGTGSNMSKIVEADLAGDLPFISDYGAIITYEGN